MDGCHVLGEEILPFGQGHVHHALPVEKHDVEDAVHEALLHPIDVIHAGARGGEGPILTEVPELLCSQVVQQELSVQDATADSHQLLE